MCQNFRKFLGPVFEKFDVFYIKSDFFQPNYVKLLRLADVADKSYKLICGYVIIKISSHVLLFKLNTKTSLKC